MALAPFVRRFESLTELREFREEEVGGKWGEYRRRLMSEFGFFRSLLHTPIYSPILPFPASLLTPLFPLNNAERPSLINTTSEDEYYKPILERYFKNEAQSAVANATRDGEGLP